MTNVLLEVRSLVLREQLIAPEDRIVVAVSGGPDSVALLHVLRELAREMGLRLVAAHVNHGLRGEESDREEKGVRELAERWGIPLETCSPDIAAFARKAGLGTQEAARIKRYEFLENVALAHGCSRIALGHHADDQAETVLMRILRGAGTDGMKGIPLRRKLNDRVELIRPLLRIHKKELLVHCERHQLPYFTDSSNLESKYFRNRVRLEAIPYLEKLNPGLVPGLIRLGEILGAEGDFLDGETRRLFEQSVTSASGGYALSRKEFLGFHVALQRRLIKLILSYLFPHAEAIDFDKVESVRLASCGELPSTLTLDLGDGVSFVREYDLIRFVFHPPRKLPPFRYELEGERGRLELRELGASLEWQVLDPDETGTGNRPLRQDADGAAEAASKSFEGRGEGADGRSGSEAGGGIDAGAGEGILEAVFDLDRIHWPLSVRNRRPGDRMSWPGLNGSRKVKDLFIDLKIPPSRRDRIPLLVDARGNVLWIPGLRRSVHGACDADTRRRLHIIFRPYIH